MDPAAAGRIGRLRLALAGGANIRFADAPDIDAARRIEARWPGTGAWYRAALRFHARAATWAVTAGGCAGVVFGAFGYPPARAPHVSAAQASPGARFAYASADPGAAYLGGALLGAPNVTAVRGDASDPAALLALPEVAGAGSPLMVQVQMCMHYWSPAHCAAAVGCYAARLPPGSVLAATLWTGEGPGAREFTGALSAASGAPAYAHPRESVRGWARLPGLEPVGPGVADVRAAGLSWTARELPSRTPARVDVAVYRVAR